MGSSSTRQTSSGDGKGKATDVTAPVPGKVVAVKVAEGQEIAEDVAAFILESMKMEFEVKTRRAGRIGAVRVKLGEQVTAGQQLADWGD